MPESKSDSSLFQLQGKAVLVTGSSRGIGAGIAKALGTVGAKVGVTYTGASSEDKARAVCEEVQKAGGEARAYALNVADEAQCTQVVETFVKDFGALHGLVNNAGVAIDNLVMRYKSEDFDKVISINLKGAFLMSKAAIRPLMKAGGGSIVNMTSTVALSGNAGQVPYSASKAALIGMSKSLAREVGSRQIRVNCIAPGFIETDMTGALNEEQKEKYLPNIPLGSFGSVEDIAWGTLYLLSPLSRYVTGQVLVINGGLHM